MHLINNGALPTTVWERVVKYCDTHTLLALATVSSEINCVVRCPLCRNTPCYKIKTANRAYWNFVHSGAFYTDEYRRLTHLWAQNHPQEVTCGKNAIDTDKIVAVYRMQKSLPRTHYIKDAEYDLISKGEFDYYKV